MPGSPDFAPCPAPALTCAAPPPERKTRGNPALNLSPRCDARTRSGCPCRAPAIRGRHRCRMHGGRSTGPRTPEGLQRLRNARTVHGRYGGMARARDRHFLTMVRRASVQLDALRYAERLPPGLAARLHTAFPPEFDFPPHPTTPLTTAQDRAIREAEAEALAPWKQAIAEIRAADRIRRAAAKAHAPDPAAGAPAGRAAPERGGAILPPRQDPMHQVAAPATTATRTAPARQQASAEIRAADRISRTAAKPHAPDPAAGAATGAPAGRAAPERGGEILSPRQDPMHQMAPRPPAPAGAEPAKAPVAACAGPAAPAAAASAKPPAAGRMPGQASPRPAVASPPATPHAPVAAPPACPAAPAPRATAAPHAGGRRQRLLAGISVASLALFHAGAAAPAAGRLAPSIVAGNGSCLIVRR